MLQYTHYVWNRSLPLTHLLNHRAGKYEYFIYLTIISNSMLVLEEMNGISVVKTTVMLYFQKPFQ